MPAPTHIGLVTSAWTPEVGADASLGEPFARTLLAAGLKPSVFTVDRNSKRAPYTVREEEVAGVSVRRVHLPAAAPTDARDLEADPRIASLVRSWIADHALDLVHTLDHGPVGLGAALATQSAGRIHIAHVLDHKALCPRGRMIDFEGQACDAPSSNRCAECQGQSWMRMQATPESSGRRTSRAIALLRGANAILAPSASMIESLVQAGLERKSITLCAPGVEANALGLATELARRGVSPGRRLGFLGATRPSSGVLELAHAVCLSERPGLTLEVHGPLVDTHGDATYLNALKRLADLDPRVRLHGAYSRTDLPRVLATLDAVAAPDTWEPGTALSLREARAVGLPALVSDRGVHVELGEDPGIRVVQGDLAPWIEAIQDLDFTRTRPAPVRSLLSMAEQLLGVYRLAALSAPIPG